jgi:CheY-like chemotaxis protein
MSGEEPLILVVDDDVDTCRNLCDILTDLGLHVDTAHDGPSALEKIRRQPYDVALLDYKMPGMDGLTLYREIRKIRSETVAIVITAYASTAASEEALGAGAWQILAKPVDFPKLLKLIADAMDQPLVLVVDDDPALCANLWDLLRDRGYRVAIAHDESAAEGQLRDSSFQAVLIDVKLPKGDGHSVFQLVRQANPQARTIVITGHRSETDEQVQKIVDSGADAVCYKPFDMPQLLQTLDQLTQRKPGA